MKAFLEEFKNFAMRGNVIDMAVGVVIGAAFGKIVSSLVSNVIMPPLGVLIFYCAEYDTASGDACRSAGTGDSGDCVRPVFKHRT